MLMRNSMAVTLAESCMAAVTSPTLLKVRVRMPKARVTRAPAAAASVGVKRPAYSPPSTMTAIRITGHI